MQQFVLSLHVILAAAIILFILFQQGKGADAGAAFGAGASGTVFGSRGSGNFMSRTTAVLAVMFFASSSYLAYFHAREGAQNNSIIDTLAVEESSVPSLLPDGDIPDVIPSEIPVLPTEPEDQSEPDPEQ